MTKFIGFIIVIFSGLLILSFLATDAEASGHFLLPPCYTFGDVNNDRIITQADADEIVLLSGNSVRSGARQLRADVNDDNQINGTDALLVSQYALGLPVTFSVCSPAVNQAPTTCHPSGNAYAVGGDSNINKFDVLKVLEQEVGFDPPWGDDELQDANVNGYTRAPTTSHLNSIDAEVIFQFMDRIITTFGICPEIDVSSIGASSVFINGSQGGTNITTNNPIRPWASSIDINTRLTAPATASGANYDSWSGSGDCTSINNSIRECRVTLINDIQQNSKSVSVNYIAGVPSPPPSSCTLIRGDNRMQGCYYEMTNQSHGIWPPQLQNPSQTAPSGPNNGDWANNGPVGDNVIALDVNPPSPSSPPNGPGPSWYEGVWEGRFMFKAGTYTFYVGSDDGEKFYIDNNLETEFWGARGWTEDNKNVTFSSQSVHDLKLYYYQGSGAARVTLRWVYLGPPVSPSPSAVPTPTPTPPPSVCGINIQDNKMTGCYYDMPTTAHGAAFQAVSPSEIAQSGPNYGDNDAGPVGDNPSAAQVFHISPNPSASWGDSWFFGAWEGRYRFKAGTYRFFPGSDDGEIFYVDGQEKVRYWSTTGRGHAEDPIDVTFPAEAERDLRIEYYQGGGAASVSLRWQYLGPPPTPTPPPAGITISGFSYCLGSDSIVALLITANTSDNRFWIWRDIPAGWFDQTGINEFFWESSPQAPNVWRQYKVMGQSSPFVESNTVSILSATCGNEPDLTIVNNSHNNSPLITVTGGTISGNTVTAGLNSSVTFEFRTRNIGTAPVGQYSTSVVEAFSSTYPGGKEEFAVDLLGSNASSTTHSITTSWSSVGSHGMLFRADANGNVPEGDESNNSVNLTVEVGVGPPDLQISSFLLREYDGASCTGNPLVSAAAGDDICFEANVTNVGAPFTGNINNSFHADSTEPACDAVASPPSASNATMINLLNGETKPFNGGPVQVPSGSTGTGTAQLHIDYTCDIQENGDTEVSPGNWDESSILPTTNHRSITYTIDSANWLETTRGDVGAVGTVSMASSGVPCQSEYLLIAGSIGNACSDRWEVSNYNRPLVQSGGVYNYFNNRFGDEARTNPISNCNTDTFPTGMSYCGSSIAFNDASRLPSSGSAVIFIEGELVITGNLNIGSASIVFVVKDNIIVLNGASEIDGVYISGQEFVDCVFSCSSVNPLVVNGSIYANSMFVTNSRNLSSGSGPSLIVNFEPRYLVDDEIRRMIGTPSIVWREVAP